MQDQNSYDDLEEMRVPQDPGDIQSETDGDGRGGQRRTKGKAVSGGSTVKQARKAEKEAVRARENKRMIVFVAAAFIVLLVVLVAVGIFMSDRAGTLSQNASQDQSESTRLEMAAGKSYFKNDGNRPEMSEEGVKGAITEAYYTEDGSLAVTLSLSNGKETDQRLSRLSLRILNKNGDLIAERAFDGFNPEIVVQAGGYESAYLVIDPSYVKLTDDPLSSLTVTLEITSAAV